MRFLSLAASILAAVLLSGCVHEPGVLPTATTDAGYPEHIRAIMVDRCATAGCHNDASSANAKGLNLSTWTKLFEGSSSGAAVVPYNVLNSSLLHFVNRDAGLGPVATPAMPYNSLDPDNPINPLTRDEYVALRDWVAAGAPNKNGDFPFASAAETRQKIYCTMQGCDLLGVIDAESGVVMRYLQVGRTSGVESPHCVRVSPDGRYAYVCFYSSNLVQKIDTRTDEIVGEVDLTEVDPPGTLNGSWNVLHLSSDGERFVITNWKDDGHVVIVRTADMKVERYFGGGGSRTFRLPHGVIAVPTFDTFLVTAEYGNVVYRISPNGFLYKEIVINDKPKVFGASPDPANPNPDPHEIIFSPDCSRYFLTCQGTGEVRVMDAKNDALLKVINVGTRPREMAVSRTYPYLFVTCEEGTSAANSAMRGSVYCIDYNTLQIVKKLDDGLFFQPHGVSVDDRGGKLYVASKNADPNGPRQHHASSCSGRNGWYTVYNLSSLQPVSSKRYEVSVEPYSMDVRFKN